MLDRLLAIGAALALIFLSLLWAFHEGLLSVDTFYISKGLLAMLGVVLLIWHMASSWDDIAKLGQRLRYITLLWFASTITQASVHQIQVHRPIELSSILTFVGCVLLVITMIVSIKESRETPAGVVH